MGVAPAWYMVTQQKLASMAEGIVCLVERNRVGLTRHRLR